MHTISHVTGGMLWANLHLLFWLSLIPFVTGWMGENHFAPLACGALWLRTPDVRLRLVAAASLHGGDAGRKSTLALAVGRDLKGKISPILYLSGIITAFFNGYLSDAAYVLGALMWLVPDRRFEKATPAP